MRRIATGLAATIGLALIMFGMPALLITVGPVGLPHVELSIQGIWQALLRPDDGTVFLTLVKVVGWGAWAILTFSVIAEIIARLRHVHVPALPGLAIPQSFARGLVAAALTLFLTSQGSLAEPTDAGHPPTAVAAPLAAPSHRTPQPAAQTQEFEPYTVRKGDILSQIALDHLGDAHRYPDIYQASKRLRQPGGAHLRDPDVIDIGWKLNIPTDIPDKQDKEEPTAHKPESDRPQPTVPTPAPPTPTPATATATTGTAPSKAERPAAELPDAADSGQPGWLLPGLAGAGAILAGSLWLALGRRRALQHHHRRPGLMTAPPPLDTVPVEKTLRHEGQPIGDLLTFVDQTLRRLAASILADEQQLPALVAIEVARSSLTVYLDPTTPLAEPWRQEGSPNTWSITTDDDPETIGPLAPDGPAPWPHLATIGADHTGHWWLLNLEHLGIATVSGDSDFADDLVRYLAAELATNPWSRDLEIDLVGVYHELTGLNPSHIHHHSEVSGIDHAVAAAVDTADRITLTHSPDAATARARQDGDDLWPGRVLITRAEVGGNLNRLVELVATMPGRTATAAILTGPTDASPDSVQIVAGADGRVRIPTLGLDLFANGITIDEARGAVQLLQAAADLSGVAVPATEAGGPAWRQLCDESGALNDTLTTPRDHDGAPDNLTSVLPEPDTAILESSATTADDLAALAPGVPEHTTRQVADADPTLDADIADWFAEECDRPRITVLGNMKVRVGKAGDVTDANRRKPYYTELVAYLATKPDGATVDEVRAAFQLAPDQVRRDLAVVRKWLGIDPQGHRYLPEAARSQASAHRGSNVYRLRDVLYDANLLRRLRLRGQTRGPNGLTDFMTGLRLVAGAPYANIRPGAGIWLTDRRDDQHLLVAIVDVAHLAATMALRSGDLHTAEKAARTALRVAPEEETPKLDLAAVTEAQGHFDASAQVAREIWNQRDPDGPLELDSRTTDLLLAKGWVPPRTQSA